MKKVYQAISLIILFVALPLAQAGAQTRTTSTIDTVVKKSNALTLEQRQQLEREQKELKKAQAEQKKIEKAAQKAEKERKKQEKAQVKAEKERAKNEKKYDKATKKAAALEKSIDKRMKAIEKAEDSLDKKIRQGKISEIDENKAQIKISQQRIKLKELENDLDKVNRELRKLR